jgi:hypothetical protein
LIIVVAIGVVIGAIVIVTSTIGTGTKANFANSWKWISEVTIVAFS